MLSREALDAYRRMTPDQRLALTLQAMRESIPYLLSGSPEVVDRRFKLIRRENGPAQSADAGTSRGRGDAE